ncbi:MULTISPECIES: Panacea domain-containing protein [unclassified Psychrobacter]|uniref:Panacea domain-containing protein n=1 Tax=unclassified Psychrobacter TaxID=196806 RepID=UPI000EDF6C02|nr:MULTISPECIES: Panacea domain-containing protein [unclassified Psychrobacter]MBE8609338.1 SocA family protein [Pseudomonas lundensis]HCI74827.1 hypothetical protein [Psychrobacter sp.]
MKLELIIIYFCKYYPYTNELSNSRLTKLVYLADWFSCLLKGKQMSEILWLFNHYGPYVNDVLEEVNKSNYLDVEMDFNFYGSPKYVIKLINENNIFSEEVISQDDKRILDFVISKTKTMHYNSFIDYVYSTYPVSSSQRYNNLNLIDLAQEYKSNSSYI